MPRFATILGFCLILVGCATAPQTTNLAPYNPKLLAQQPIARLPLIDEGIRLWRVRAFVNGHEGLFAVDTGSDTTIINPQFAKKIGALTNPAPRPAANRMPIVQPARFAKITCLQLGGILYLNFYAPIRNLDHINQAMRTPIDGILGNHVLRKTACIIDWRHNLLTLETAFPPRPTNAIPLTLRGNRIFLDTLINGCAAELALDTGAYCSSLTSNELDRLEIPEAKKTPLTTHRIDIKRSDWEVQTQATLDRFQVSPITRENFPMLTWDHNVVGMDMLDSWMLTLDERAGWMVLTAY